MATLAPAPPQGLSVATRTACARIGIYLVTTIQFLDGTIANVALPHMQPALGASLETISWVITSFMLASAIAIPITGWLANRIGSRRLFLLSAIGFIVTSAACGAAANIEAMVLFRVLQGLSAAFITPLSQSIILDITPKEQHTKALSQWGMMAMVAPIIGPVVGGYITENYSWRWIFYVNLPIGIPGLVLLWLGLPHTSVRRERLDLFGFVLIAISLAAFQLVLDRGQSKDWLESPEIVMEAVVACCAMWMFAVHAVTAPNPLFPRELLATRTVILGMFIMLVMGFLTYGLAALLPSLIQQVYHYNALDAGMLSSPRGLGVIAGLMLSGRVLRLVEGRWLIFGGYAIAGLSVHMMSGWGPYISSTEILTWSVIQGFGMGLTFTPMNALVYESLPAELRTGAASLMNLMRNVGASIGVSLFATNLAWSVQVNHQELSERISEQVPAMVDPQRLAILGNVGEAVLHLADIEVNRQALMIGYINNLAMLSWIIFAALPLMLALRRPRR